MYAPSPPVPHIVCLLTTPSAGAMHKSNVLCKSLSTVESLGSVDIIASDKTGTLTQNKMSVANLAIGEARYSAADARETAVKGGGQGQAIQILSAIAAMCNDARFDGDNTGDMPLELKKINGDATGEHLMCFWQRFWCLV